MQSAVRATQSQGHAAPQPQWDMVRPDVIFNRHAPRTSVGTGRETGSWSVPVHPLHIPANETVAAPKVVSEPPSFTATASRPASGFHACVPTWRWALVPVNVPSQTNGPVPSVERPGRLVLASGTGKEPPTPTPPRQVNMYVRPEVPTGILCQPSGHPPPPLQVRPTIPQR